MKRFSFRNKRVLHLTAAMLIVCMGLCDATLYMRYANGAAGDLRIITEEHEMEQAFADGDYNGRNSDHESGDGGSVDLTTTITEQIRGKKTFTILEILPTEKKGVVGYTIGGCEPFDVDAVELDGEIRATKSDMKSACMDAIFNKNPGSANANDQNIINNGYPYILKEMNEKIKECGNSYPFKFEYGKAYRGYYKYVGPNQGVYSIDNPNSSRPTVKSRYYYSGSNFDYIFIYDQQKPVDSPYPDVNISTPEKRFKCINNDKFIRDWLISENNSLSNAQLDQEVSDMKQNIVFDVITRTPRTVEIDDINRADLILINNASKNDYYKFALKLQNQLRGINPDEKDNGLHFYSPENDGNVSRNKRIDFDDFQKVIKIYERIVVANDAAIIVEEFNTTTTYGEQHIRQINTNLRKLMFMLFFIQQGNTKQTGRDMFADFFKRYTDCPGELYGADPENPDNNITYLEMRKRYLADLEKKKADPGYKVNYYVDYRGTSLKRNSDDPASPDYYFSHSHADSPVEHVGHPLVLDKNLAKTGAKLLTETRNGVTIYYPALDGDGRIIAEHDDDFLENHRRLEIERADEFMFTDAGIQRQYGTNYPGKYYQDWDGRFKYKYCYESMSNTTDYIYIDNQGRLVISDEFSSDQKSGNRNWKYYWYRIDSDDSIPGYDFRRRKWSAKTYGIDDPWPWDSSGDGKPLTEWLMGKSSNDPYNCNMHMWYDYYDFADLMGRQKYTSSQYPNVGTVCDNQVLVQANGFFKYNWLKDVLKNRDHQREKNAPIYTVEREEVTSRDYYISMNIVNGDGVNRRSVESNKILYYNQYESSRIDNYENNTLTGHPNPDKNAYIPLSIELKSSCEIKNVVLTDLSDPSKTVTYVFDENGLDLTGQSSVTGTGGKGLNLERKPGTHTGNVPTEKTADFTPIHTFTGTINDMMHSWYKDRRNTKIRVTLTVELPDGSDKTITDDITIVKRDFFMLD